MSQASFPLGFRGRAMELRLAREHLSLRDLTGFLAVALLCTVQASCSVPDTVVEQDRPFSEGLVEYDALSALSSPSGVFGTPEPLPSVFLDRSGESPVAFHEVSGVIVLPGRGLTIVANNGTSSLFFFGSAGRLRFSAGREGDGPGEFRSLRGLWRYGTDSLLTFDPILQRGTVWSLEGDVGRTIEVRDPPRDLRYFGLRGPLTDGRLVWSAPGSVESGTGTRSVPENIFVTSRTGELGGVFGPFPGEERTERRGAFDLGEVPFGSRLLVGVRRDKILLTNTRRFVVAVYRPSGWRSGVLGLRLAARPVTDEWIRKDAARRTAWYRSGPMSPLRQSRLADIGSLVYPDSFPVTSSMLVAPEGHIWLAEYALPHDSTPSPMHSPPETVSNVWHVFDDAGVYVGQVTFPEGFVALDVSGDLIAGVWRDNLDVEHIRVFRINRPLR